MIAWNCVLKVGLGSNSTSTIQELCDPGQSLEPLCTWISRPVKWRLKKVIPTLVSMFCGLEVINVKCLVLHGLCTQQTESLSIIHGSDDGGAVAEPLR